MRFPWRLLGAVLLLATACPGGSAAADDPRPNVLFLLVDDLGYTDLGCFGSTFYETPNIDRLAASGARLTNAYAACPVCSPTRVGIMSGTHPARLATTEWFGARQADRWRKNTKLLPARYQDRLPSSETTLAEALGGAGYATFFAGKWHMGPEGSWPEDHGFAINRGGCEWGQPKGGKRYFSPYGNPRLDDGPEGEHLTDRLADETCEFIRANARKPFLAYLSFYTVHTPLMAPDAAVEKYEAKRAAQGDAIADRWGRERRNRVRQVQNLPVYAAMVESLDKAVGRVLDTLDQQGVADNTIVVLTSDNGGLSTAEGYPTSNLPLRGGKGWLYEGGVRVPGILRWPGVTKPGDVCDTPVTSMDYYPTLLGAAGVGMPTPRHADGEDLRSVLRGESEDHGPLFWHYPHYSNQGGGPGAAVRDGRWKLIRWYEDKSLELYDLATDLGETKDLAAELPEVVQRLHARLDAWLQAMQAKMPTPNPAYDPDLAAAAD